MAVSKARSTLPPPWRAAIEASMARGAPTLVFDRRVVDPGAVATLDPPVPCAADQLTRVDLTDAGRWHALVRPGPATASRDLSFLARAFATWRALPTQRIEAPLPTFERAALDEPVSGAWVVKALYEGPTESTKSADRQLGGKDVLHAWRRHLRALGESPRALVDDPWFSRLFLHPSAPAISLDRRLVWVDVRAPAVPGWAASRIAAVVSDRLAEVTSVDDDAGHPTIFLLDGAELHSAVQAVLGDGEAIRLVTLPCSPEAEPTSDVTPAPPPPLDSDRGDAEPTSDDAAKALYLMFSSTLDKRHRPTFVKSLMYGYHAFSLEGEHSDQDNAALAADGLVPAMGSPLVEIPEEW